jgi:hypothetical protein
MKYTNRLTWIAVAALVAVALLLGRDLGHTILAQSNATPTPNVNWVDTRSGINVRSGPGYNYDPIGGLALGAWVQPIARSKDGQWILIAYQSGQGWIQRDGVFWRLNTAALPVVSGNSFTPIPPDAFSAGAGSPTYTPNANWVNVGLDRAYVRSGPGQGWLPVGQALTGQVVDPVAIDPSGDWVLISYGSGYGWISRNLVLWITDIGSLPVYEDTNLTPAFTTAPTIALVTNTPTLAITHTIAPTNTQAGAATRPPTEMASPTTGASRTPTASTAPNTSTPRPATKTSVPPTNTTVPATSVPTTQAPSSTPVPPTTAPSSTPAPTNTRIPPTVVPTEPPVEPTNTAVPPTATPRPANTAVPPTQSPATEAATEPSSATAPPLLILPPEN